MGSRAPNAIAPRKRLRRTLCQPDAEVGIALHDSSGKGHVIGREWFELICTAGDFADERHLRLVADPAANQIVQLGQHERREETGRTGRHERRDGTAVQRLVRIERGVEPPPCRARSLGAEAFERAIDVCGD